MNKEESDDSSLNGFFRFYVIHIERTHFGQVDISICPNLSNDLSSSWMV